jgi:hypothetical protein
MPALQIACFVDSPHVSLPGPSHLVQMCIPDGAVMFSGKADLADYYHHMGGEHTIDCFGSRGEGCHRRQHTIDEVKVFNTATSYTRPR